MLLRERNRNDISVVAKYAHANAKLKRRSDLVLKILEQISMYGLIDIPSCHAAVVSCMNLTGRDYELVSQAVAARSSFASERSLANRDANAWRRHRVRAPIC